MMFKRFIGCISFCLILSTVTIVNAQITGDYRSIGDANWDVDANWQRWNGAAWVAPGAFGYPGETAALANTTVTIIANDDVTLNVTPPFSIVNLTIESGTFLNPTQLDTSGNPSLTITGSLTQGNPGGSALRTSFTFGGTGNLSISGNAIITGTTILASTFTFSSSGLMSVGVNLSISREIDFTISGGSLSVGGSITTQGIGNTTDVLFSTTGNITVSGNTTILTNSSITDSDNTGVSTFTGRVSNTGTWTSTAVTTPARMIFRGGITDTAPGIFSAGAGTFDLNNQTLVGDGNISFLQAVNITGVTLDNTNTGSFSVAGTTTLATSGGFTDSSDSGLTIFGGNLNIGAGTSFISTAVTTNANMIFRGGIANSNVFTAGGATFNTNNQAITGASSLSFANNVAITAVTVTNSNTANLTITGTTTLATSGGFTDSDNTGITTLVGNVSVGAGTSFISTAVTTTGNLVFRGGIANANSISAGGATFNTNNQSITGAGSLSFANNVAITGVTVTNSNTANLTITGTTTLGTSGGFTDSDNTGITTLVGNVSVGAGTSFISTAVTTTGNLVFRGGIANANTFNAGGATFNTNPQSLTGAGTLTFAQIVTVTGIAVTNNATVSMTSTGAATLTGSGSWTQGTGTLNFAGSTLTVTTFDASAVGNTVIYNSSVAQTIRVPSTTYYNLTTNNTFATSPQLTAGGSLTVTNQMTMQDGNIDLNTTTFTIGVSAAAPGTLSHAGAAANGWLFGGTLRRFINTTAITIGNVAGFFPLGTSGTTGDFRPFNIATSGVTTGGSLSLSHTNATTTTIVNIPDGVNIIRRHDAFWSCSTSGIVGGGTNYALRYGGTNFGTITDLTHMKSCLVASVVGSHVVATLVSTSDPRVERSGLSLANMTNNFYVGSTNVASPLPVELTSFKGELTNQIVRLFWSTASELNNDFFTIERLNEGDQFDQIAKVKGSGTINEARSYQAYDFAPRTGKNYYRLKQTDLDGQFAYSKIVMVDFQGPDELVSIFPNPTNQETITVEVKRLKPGQQVPVQIRSTLGAQAFSKMLTADSSGNIEALIQVDKWAQGLYLIQIGIEKGIQRKIIIE